MIAPTPIRDLQVGLWVVLEEVGMTRITGLEYFSESVDIEFDSTDSPLPRHLARQTYGVWSGLFTDFPHIAVYHHEDYS